mgnify:CR=1 FL=1
MKIAEIRELSTKELLERVDAEVAAYDQRRLTIASRLWIILLRLNSNAD